MIGRRSNVLKVTQFVAEERLTCRRVKALSTDQNTSVFSRKKSLLQKPAGKFNRTHLIFMMN